VKYDIKILQGVILFKRLHTPLTRRHKLHKNADYLHRRRKRVTN